MPQDPRRVARVLLLLVPVPLGLAASQVPGGPGSTLARLRAMPVELRRALAGNLDRFAALDRGEQDALLALEASVAGRPPEERARDYDLMQRYHAWLGTLTEEQRGRLTAATPAERLALIRSIREGDPAAAPGPGEGSLWTLSGAFNPVGLAEEAHQARLWKVLSHDQKVELASDLPEGQRMILAESMSSRQGGQGVRYRDVSAEAVGQRNQLLALIRERKPLQAQIQTKLKSLRQIQARFFRRHPPPVLEPRELARFESELPSWLRERISGMPPEAARERLAALHYLVHDPATVDTPPPPRPARPADPAAEKAKAAKSAKAPKGSAEKTN